MLIGGEQSDAGSRKQFGHEESRGGDTGGGNDRQLQYAHQSVGALRPVVVAGNGLHALVESDADHHEHEGKPVAAKVDSKTLSDLGLTDANTISQTTADLLKDLEGSDYTTNSVAALDDVDFSKLD